MWDNYIIPLVGVEEEDQNCQSAVGDGESQCNSPQFTSLEGEMVRSVTSDCLNELQLVLHFAAFLRIQDAVASNCSMAIKI